MGYSIVEYSGELEYLFGPYNVRERRRASDHFSECGGGPRSKKKGEWSVGVLMRGCSSALFRSLIRP